VASFTIYGMDETVAELKRMNELTGPMAKEMVEEGGEAIADSWRRVIVERGHVDTGAMRDNVRAGEAVVKSGVMTGEIYPRGKDRHGVRNAEKAFLLHYGWKAGKAARGKKGTKATGRKGSYRGDRFVDVVEDECEATVGYVMENVMNRYIR
jgi:hypothetical protein